MIDFVITVPPETPELLYLTGSGERLGHWRADALKLDRWGDGTYRTRLELPPGPVRYLVTRGHWRWAENDGHGRERAPRELDVTGPLAVDLHVVGWGRDAIRDHPDTRSAFLDHPRPVLVHLPPGYDLEPQRRYPVLYLQDGQNLFDARTAFAGVPWGCDETVERLARSGAAAQVILVAVGNSPDRLHEYGPRLEDGLYSPARKYARFLVEELKPIIDRTYRTLEGPEHTGIGGSSMGGLIALHLCRWHPAIFGRCAALSPSLWWDRESFLHNVPASGLDRCRVWLDMGAQEGETPVGRRANVRRARRLAMMLERARIDYRFVEDPDGGHDEATWGRRFGPALTFLFPGCPQGSKNVTTL